jgi:hypothetical protein
MPCERWEPEPHQILIRSRKIMMQLGNTSNNGTLGWVEQKGFYTVKGARGKVSFDSQNDKYTQLSCDTSSEAYL